VTVKKSLSLIFYIFIAYDFILEIGSALGLRPRLEQTVSLEFLKGIQKQQESLMFSAAFLLKPGGSMVYSTCTFNPMENECVIANTLKQYPLELIPLPSPVNQLGEIGMEGFGLTKEQCSLVRRFNPHSKFDTIGFFIARLRKYDTIRSKESVEKFQNARKKRQKS
jgi:methyltransferase NSUN6